MASIDNHQDQCPILHHILAADLQSWAVPEIFISELKQLLIFLSCFIAFSLCHYHFFCLSLSVALLYLTSECRVCTKLKTQHKSATSFHMSQSPEEFMNRSIRS